MTITPRFKLLAAAFGFAALLGGSVAFAHPHVWATMETGIVMNEAKEITGLRHKWTFDEYYTADAITGLDTNGDGVPTPQGLKLLADTNVEALGEFGYFTFPVVGDNKVGLKKPTEYHLEFKDKLLTLYFDLPFEAPVPAAELANFSLRVFDPSYYVAMSFAEGTPVNVIAPSAACEATLDQPQRPRETTLAQMGESLPSQYGALYAQKITVACK